MQNICPRCQSPIPADAPSGLCPACLLLGVAASTNASQAAAMNVPAIEEVTAAFPELEVLDIIGHGGMGVVFKVRQPKLNRFAALKLLPQSIAADPAFATRFEREAQLLAKLNHPNIVAVYDYGQRGGFFYLLMEYVDGVNLRQAMRASRFTPAQALNIVPRICEALQFAHDEHVLHRDIKPENILLDAKGRVKLVDFGIAKLIGDGTPEFKHPYEVHLTQAVTSLGTPAYMAPEQRAAPGDVDHRADIYSLGVVFYELLTGELPYGAFVPPSAKSTADPRVDAIVAQALENERERRQQSAAEVKTQVEGMTSNPEQKSQQQPSPGLAAPPSVPRHPPQNPMNKHTQIVALLHIGLGAFSLLAAIVVFAVFGMVGGIVISQGEHEAAGVLGIIAVFIAGFLAVLALPGIIGGLGLYRGRSWGRPVVLVLGVLHLANIPFGTALGIYTLWALLNESPAPAPLPAPSSPPPIG